MTVMAAAMTTGMAMGRRLGIMLAAGALCGFTAQAQTPATPAATAAAAAPAPAAAAPHVYGRIERALVTGSPSIEVAAQLDGGGDATVLLVNDIKYASGEGGMYVHFTIDNGQVMSGRTVNLALRVLKDQHVRDRDGGVVHHPIVAMNFCIGSHAFSSNVTLEPRNSYTPPLVLSKADAAQFAPIDPTKKNTGDANCAAPVAPAATAPVSAAH